MGNVRKQKHDKRKKEADSNFFAIKTTFVAGIVVLLTIVKDIIELCIQPPVWTEGVYLLICFITYILVLCTTICDKKMRTKNVSNFGNYLTMVSIIIFMIENSVIEFVDNMRIEVILTVSIIGGVAIIGAIYLLFAKHKD